MRLCCSKTPSIRRRHSARTPISLPTAHRSSVLPHQGSRHLPALCPARGACSSPFSSRFSSGFAFWSIVVAGPSGGPHGGRDCPLLPATVAFFGFGLTEYPGRLMVRNFRTPCSSSHRCSSGLSVSPSQTSSNHFPSNLPRNSLHPGTRARLLRRRRGRLCSCCCATPREASCRLTAHGTCKSANNAAPSNGSVGDPSVDCLPNLCLRGVCHRAQLSHARSMFSMMP